MKPLSALLFVLTALPAAADDTVFFNQDIRPILSGRCIQCHGPDSDKGRKAGLRLDRADTPEGAYRTKDGVTAIKPGELSGSEAWTRISSADPDEIMPPPQSESHVKALTDREKDLLKKWIEQGAVYEDFWAFVPPREIAPPPVQTTEWSAQPIDQYVMARLEEKNLTPKAEADRRTLIRRVTFDLTGLPPTLTEIEDFLHDDSADAWPRLVDRLMARPAYGEHMARYWLDLVRFADTNGMHHDHYREVTPYRDWVIRSFNNNLSYDKFLTDQLAGDLFAQPTTDQLIASGFNRLHLIIDVGTALPEESYTKNVIDRTSAVGTAFMGLTLGCAVCHDHKYDPITQKDFYQMFAFFNNFDGEEETGSRGAPEFKRGLQKPWLDLPTPGQSEKRAVLDSEIRRLQAALTEIAKSTPAKSAEQEKTQAALTKSVKARDALLQTVPATLVMRERKEIRPAYILKRGVYDQFGEEVERNTPSFLPPMPKTDGPKSRMDLAAWFTSPQNPLTARVAVNRFWQQFFGTGLVKTSEDFGAQGEWPSHPKLLDHLALEFINSGWDIKDLVRSFVLTKTYRQSSIAPAEDFQTDRENRLLSRASRYHMDAEMIRDEILSVSGLLNPEMYGLSVKPPQPADLWKSVTMPTSYPREFVASTGSEIYRRSLYTFWKRGFPPPQMTIFDAPNRDTCIARRERTNTPLQALLLMNESQYFDAAMHLAADLTADSSHSEDDILRRAWETITSQTPSPRELSAMKASREEFLTEYRHDPAAAATMLAASLSPQIRTLTDPARQAELASWTMIVHSLLNLDATKTRE